MTNLSVHIEGLDELQAGIRTTDRSTGTALGRANAKVGGKVEDWSEQRRKSMAVQYPSYGSRIVDIRATSSRRQAEIQVTPGAAERGITRHPVFGRWMDQIRFRRQVWPYPDRDGHLVGPSVNQHDDQIADEYLDAVSVLARRHIGA